MPDASIPRFTIFISRLRPELHLFFFPAPFFHIPYGIGLFPDVFQSFHNPFLVVFSRHQRHSYSEVECPSHLLIRYIPLFLHVSEDKRNRPASPADYGLNIRRKNPRQVFSKAAPRYMRDALDPEGFRKRKHRLHVYARRGEEGFPYCFSETPWPVFQFQVQFFKEKFSCERITVTVKPARSEKHTS